MPTKLWKKVLGQNFLEPTWKKLPRPKLSRTNLDKTPGLKKLSRTPENKTQAKQDKTRSKNNKNNKKNKKNNNKNPRQESIPKGWMGVISVEYMYVLPRPRGIRGQQRDRRARRTRPSSHTVRP